jgi:DNA helicase-2/ATP-dependent DNA helicase PcrA
MSDKSNLNPEQQAAADWGKGPALVLAGPGSGKTHTITARIMRLIREDGIPPDQILAITFTKAAALSMQSRFMAVSGGPVTFCTFHSLFYHILKEASYPVRNLITPQDKMKLLLPLLKKRRIALPDGSMEEVGQLMEAFSYYKNTGDTKRGVQNLSERWRQDFPALFVAYEEERTARGKMDFDDMAYLCDKLFQKEAEHLRRWRSRFSYILVDEFQDINPVQYSVLRKLCAPPYNLFAVGDDDQSIYGFRGSAPGLMRSFQKDYPGCKLFSLNTNYRSTPEIVSASLAVIGTNTGRFSKALWAAADSRPSSVLLKRFTQKEEQYRYIADGLKRLSKEEAMKTAVLFRTNLTMQSLVLRLSSEGIPYTRKETGTCIYDHFIVKDIMTYLRLGMGERSRSLFLLIRDKPWRPIPRESFREEIVSFDALKKDCFSSACNEDVVKGKFEEEKIESPLKQWSRNQERQKDERIEAQVRLYKVEKRDIEEQRQREKQSEYLGIIGWEHREQLNTLESIKDLETAIHNLSAMKPYLALHYIRKSIGYDRYLRQKAGTDDHRLKEWESILDFLAEDAKKHKEAGEWLEAQEAFRREWKQNNRKQESGVALLTVHAAKGLEYNTVYIPDINEGTYPHSRLPDQASIEEECRLLYVAMTRAKTSLELLTVTGSPDNPRLPSRYLQNLKLPN